MMNNIFRRSWFSVCVVCLAAVVLLTGCEPLRKKFTRQKKKSDAVNQKFIPVLDPEEYHVKQYGAEESYAQHYSLLKVWFSDFASTYEQTVNEKRQLYNLNAALEELQEMKKLLKSPVLEELSGIEKQILYIRGEYEKSKAFRNDARIRSEIREVQSKVNKKFKTELVKESFIAE